MSVSHSGRCRDLHSADLPLKQVAPVDSLAVVYMVALTNVVKHAEVTHAELIVQRRNGDLLIDVRDDGVGGANSAGSGIRGLRDRIEALGGQMQITSPPGRGTRLHAAIAHSATLGPDR